MDRAALLAMLVSRYGSIATEAGMTLGDEAAGFKPVLDAVDTRLWDRPELDEIWSEPLARYEALDYLADRLATQMNVTREGSSYQLNQMFTNVRALLADARSVVAWIVEPASPTGGDVPIVSMFSVVVPGPQW